MKSTLFPLFVHGAIWGLFLVLLMCGVPIIETFFSDFGIPLTDMTTLVIQASHQVTALVLSTFLLLCVDGFVLSVRSSRGEVGVSRAWHALMIAPPLVMSVLTLLALSLPFFFFCCPMRLSGSILPGFCARTGARMLGTPHRLVNDA